MLLDLFFVRPKAFVKPLAIQKEAYKVGLFLLYFCWDLVDLGGTSFIKFSIARSKDVTIGTLHVSLISCTIASLGSLNFEFPISSTCSTIIKRSLRLCFPYSCCCRRYCSCICGTQRFLCVREYVVGRIHFVANHLPASVVRAAFGHKCILQLHVG